MIFNKHVKKQIVLPSNVTIEPGDSYVYVRVKGIDDREMVMGGAFMFRRRVMYAVHKMERVSARKKKAFATSSIVDPDNIYVKKGF